MDKIKYYNECEAYALKSKGLNDPSLKESGWRIYCRRELNRVTTMAAVGKGGIIIPYVSGTLFEQESEALVATVLLQANKVKNEVALYNPIKGETEYCAMERFFEIWENSGGDCTTVFPPDANTYLPSDVDLTDESLPKDLLELKEQIAEHLHDVWATERQSEGWTYGRERNDRTLQTPDMVPFAQLLESEKRYDRLMASETLKCLLDLGYKISK